MTIIDFAEFVRLPAGTVYSISANGANAGLYRKATGDQGPGRLDYAATAVGSGSSFSYPCMPGVSPNGQRFAIHDVDDLRRMLNEITEGLAIQNDALTTNGG